MSLTPSTMLELGTEAPDFHLPTPEGKLYSLKNQAIDKGLLIVFMCNHCPYVLHIRPLLVEKVRIYQELGITVVAINSNDYATYPDDSPEKMAQAIKECAFSFPYLVDEHQVAAKTYRAACTPDFFLFDHKRRLVYRGQFDNARPGNNKEITGEDLSHAIEQLVSGRTISPEQQPSMGCNIKWKPGHEPDYLGRI
jgi:peroxiredoxin